MFIALNRDKVAFFWYFQGAVPTFSIQSSRLLFYHIFEKIVSSECHRKIFRL